ncbi:Arc family DNA-binding protein [Agrobacterium rosae]|uniref:Arc family DNA-binding protein n=1 Tax=Agrobacterium rosae TaxID=1972867 RepID=UPI003A802E99
MAEQKVGRGSDQFPLRFPDGMREQLKERAETNGRSMNSEIVALLESAVLPQPDTDHLYYRLSQREEEIEVLKRHADEWRKLAQAQVKSKNGFASILKSFCHQIIASANEIPPHIVKLANELLVVANTNMDDSQETLK